MLTRLARFAGRRANALRWLGSRDVGMETVSGMFRGLQTQLTVSQALVIRETRTRFGGHKLGYTWAVVEPITVILTFYLAYEYLGQPLSAGMDHVTFFGTGLLTYELVIITSE